MLKLNLALITALAITQTVPAADRPQFDVVSVKQNPTFTGQMQGIGSPSPGTFRARNIPLRFLCRVAYNINSFNVLGGPDWTDSAGFDIEAKTPVIPNQSRREESDRMNLMLQSVLEDRFKLKAHRETRELPVYILTVAKGGLKMKHAPCDPVGDPACQASLREAMKNWPQPVNGSWVTMDRFLVGLATMTNGRRAIIDRTGLTGVWDMHMQGDFRPAASPGADGGKAEPAEPGESIFTALEQQLGLHLDSGKAPVEVLVIDHAEKPSEN
jgi:uncharacterized protein (TIGR03435 family)